jgi:hypothetical protein
MQNFTFFRGPEVFLLFLFSLVDLFNWKRDLKIRKGSWAIFSTPAQLCTDPDPLPREKPTHYHTRASATDGRDPLVSPPLPPIPLLCSTCMATPTELPPMSRPPVTASAPQCSHLCACTLEPSHHSLVLCGVTSALLLLALLPSLRQPGMPRQVLDDEALEQPASLAKLQLSKACCVGHHLALPARMHSHVGRVR